MCAIKKWKDELNFRREDKWRMKGKSNQKPVYTFCTYKKELEKNKKHESKKYGDFKRRICEKILLAYQRYSDGFVCG